MGPFSSLVLSCMRKERACSGTPAARGRLRSTARGATGTLRSTDVDEARGVPSGGPLRYLDGDVQRHAPLLSGHNSQNPINSLRGYGGAISRALNEALFSILICRAALPSSRKTQPR